MLNVNRTIATRLAALALLAGAPLAEAQLTVTEINERQRGIRIRGWIAQVDLTDPSIDVEVTSGVPGGNNSIVNLQTVPNWKNQTGVTLAINANFFGAIGGGNGQLLGLSVSDGVLVSNPRQVSGGRFDPAIGFLADGTATVGYHDYTDAALFTHAVAGIGQGSGDNLAGDLLITNGVNTASQARINPTSRDPRTAVGVSQNGETLYIVTIDGRQGGWSDGESLLSLAERMRQLGVWNAVALDGGGSTSFVYTDPVSGQTFQNRPSDGSFRAVANHLGIRLNAPPPPPADRRTDVPIRGVWVRPPAPSLLDDAFQVYAESGVTDVYLETLYHGLATNGSSIFNQRFGFDYLGFAIDLANQYGLRIHAWTETGYIGFGGSGDYLFASNPEYRVVNNQDGTVTGDISGQAFWNLGNPGVQSILGSYFTELGQVNGLFGSHIDYHRFPIWNSGQAPYSYDTWARNEFQAQFGQDPLTAANAPGAPLWNQWLQFRRDGISQAAEVLYNATQAAHPDLEFSAAIFANAATNPSQLSKCQEWPTWAAGGYLETVIPMAYGFSTTSIGGDIDTAIASAAGQRVVPGLAILTNATRPSIPAQLNTGLARGLEDFVLFDGATLQANPSFQTDLSNWIDANATLHRSDLNADFRVDGLDFNLMLAFLATGNPPTGADEIYDLNIDGVASEADLDVFKADLSRHLFGFEGNVNLRDIDTLRAAFGASPEIVPGIINLYDLDADGDVDYDDQLRLHTMLTEAVPFDTDVDRNALVSVEDLYAQSAGPIDVNRDGVIDAADTEALEEALRAP